MPSATDQDRHHLAIRVLHWSMVVAFGAQFVLGYGIDRADGLLEAALEPWLRDVEGVLVLAHVLLGTVILVLAGVRVWWRSRVGLPPWAPGLSLLERRVAHRVEQVLYLTMFLMPLTGLALVLLSGEDWEIGAGRWRAPVEFFDDDLVLGAHITTHVVFVAALAVHVGLVLEHQLGDRDRLLRRMR